MSTRLPLLGASRGMYILAVSSGSEVQDRAGNQALLPTAGFQVEAALSESLKKTNISKPNLEFWLLHGNSHLKELHLQLLTQGRGSYKTWGHGLIGSMNKNPYFYLRWGKNYTFSVNAHQNIICLRICLTHSTSPVSRITSRTWSSSINTSELVREQLGGRSPRAWEIMLKSFGVLSETKYLFLE